MRTEKPAWCVCGDECRWYCECKPHHPVEVDIDHIPTTLYECQVCGALLKSSWRFPESTHLAWHEKHGDLA